ncbi:hypothetical protein BVRB_3g047940, partial [Beta vulgaris subsp. vulgaris]
MKTVSVGRRKFSVDFSAGISAHQGLDLPNVCWYPGYTNSFTRHDITGYHSLHPCFYAHWLVSTS